MSKKFLDTTILERLRRGEKVSAAWNQLGSNLSAEIIAVFCPCRLRKPHTGRPCSGRFPWMKACCRPG